MTPAAIVDHVKPHRGDPVKFWDVTNWQPMCAECHDRHKQRLEKSGRVLGCDVNGWPLDARHHWANEKRASEEGAVKSSEREAD